MPTKQKLLVRVLTTLFMGIMMIALQLLLAQAESGLQWLDKKDGGGAYEQEIAGHLVRPETITERLSHVGGLGAIKADIRAQVLLPLQHPAVFLDGPSETRPPRGVLLHGPPGTGKTMLAKAIAAEAKRPFVSLSLATLENKWYGETSKLLRACFAFARKHQPCVLFFDEIDGLMRRRSESDQSCVYGLKTEFLSHMDGMHTRDDDTFVVIACTNNVETLDPAVRRRLPQVYRIDPPNRREVAEILARYLQGSGIARKDVHRLARRLRAGCTGAELFELTKAAWARRRRRVVASDEFERRMRDGAVDGAYMQQALGSLQPADLFGAADERRLLAPR